MAETYLPKPVKLLIAVLWGDIEIREKAFADMQALWGKCDFQGTDHSFDVTDYYEDEMGKNLCRRIIAFQELVSPESLAEFKLRTNEIEARYSMSGQRRINLDIGYLDHNKLVLASAKSAGQKIYIGKGIYADLIARFSRGNYQPFEWTFIDFRDGRYNGELNAIRLIYLNQLRTQGREENYSSNL